jgi:hypothetical protein
MTNGVVVSPEMGQGGVPDRSKESSVTFLLQSFDGLFRERSSRAFEAVKASVKVDEREL